MPPVKQHFKEELSTGGETGMEERSNAHREVAVFHEDAKGATLDIEFAALKDALPDNTAADNTTVDVEKAESDDPQDARLADLHRKSIILWRVIKYIQYLELCRDNLRQEKAALVARVDSMRVVVKELGDHGMDEG